MSTAPKPRVRVKSPRPISYRGLAARSGEPQRAPVGELPAPLEPAKPIAGDGDAAVVLGSAAARARAAEQMEQRARQFLEDETEEGSVERTMVGKAFRAIFGKFLLSPRIVRLTKQRIVEDPAFHIRMIDKNIPTPQAIKPDDQSVRPVVLVLGTGLNLQYGESTANVGVPTKALNSAPQTVTEPVTIESTPVEGDGRFTDGEEIR